MEEKFIHKIIKEICMQNNIDFKKISYDWILKLSYKEKIKYIIEYVFDLNTAASSRIASDKYATFSTLKENNVSVISHTMMFNKKTREEYIGDLKKYENIYYENEVLGKVVVKVNDGSSGKGVYLVNEKKEFDKVVSFLFEENDNISVCPYYNIKNEYRCVYLDGEIMLVYGKDKPYIIGDGKSTVLDLIKQDFNLYEKYLEQDFDLSVDEDSVLKSNEKCVVSWKFNLSLGAKSFMLLDKELEKKVSKLAKKAGQALGIRFCTIDIVQEENDEISVLEINSSVCLATFSKQQENGYEIAKKIYTKAVLKMFE